MCVHAGCCLCIHSSAEGPAVRTECPPPWLHSEPGMPACASLVFHPPTFLILLSFVITLPIMHPPSYTLIHTHAHTYTRKPHPNENGWHFQGHLCLCVPNPPPYMHAHKCMLMYTRISWTRATAYPHTHLQHMHAHEHSQKQTTPHMRAQTWAYSHSLTGSCALFVHNPLHLFLSSWLTKACPPLITHNTHTGTHPLF